MSDFPTPTELGLELHLQPGLDVGPSKLINPDDLAEIVWTVSSTSPSSPAFFLLDPPLPSFSTSTVRLPVEYFGE